MFQFLFKEIETKPVAESLNSVYEVMKEYRMWGTDALANYAKESLQLLIEEVENEEYSKRRKSEAPKSYMAFYE